MRILPIVVALLLGACSGEEPPPPEPKQPQGRAETRSIRNTDAVGYSGSAVADKVDGALTANEEAEKKRQEEAERAAGQ